MMEYHTGSIILLLAFLLDLIAGESERLPHPVAILGRIIGWSEKYFNKSGFSDVKRKALGVVLTVALPYVAFLMTGLIIKAALTFGKLPALIISVILAYTTLSARGLGNAAFRIYNHLQRGEIEGARNALSHIVGRNTSELNESEIIRGSVESVAENSSDGVIAPLFYLFIGGIPLAMAYKTINTLDSMIGYKNERYLHFGWASAKLDDLANLIPARLTSMLMVISAFILRLDGRSACRILFRDAKKHPSPNAGYSEATTAGALGIRLGGINHYPGRVERRSFIGDEINLLRNDHIKNAISMMYLSSIIMVCLIVSFEIFIFYGV